MINTQVIYLFALAQVECTSTCNNCKQTIRSLSLLVGTTENSNFQYSALQADSWVDPEGVWGSVCPDHC